MAMLNVNVQRYHVLRSHLQYLLDHYISEDFHLKT